MKHKIHRAWWMLVGCCLLQGGCMGLINNCRGVFFDPVTQELGFGMGPFTFYMLLSGLFSCFVLPFTGKLFERFDLRLLLGVNCVVFFASNFCMGFFRSLWAFYVAGAVQGLSGAFLMFFPAPYILGHWFKRRSGLAIGICSAFSGLMGIIFNPIGTAVIAHSGWRVGYFFFAVLSLVMMLPVSLFLLRVRPEDVGEKPYGWDAADEAPEPTGAKAAVTSDVIRKKPYFLFLMVGTFLMSCVGAFNSHLGTLAISFGHTAAFGALLISASMAGNVISKFLLGSIYDRFGLKTALTVALVCSAIGVAGIFVPSQTVRLISAFLYGFSMGKGNIMTPIAVKDVYGLQNYADLLSYNTLAISFGNSLSIVVPGIIVDSAGAYNGYRICLFGCIGILLIISLIDSICIRKGRRLMAQGE